MTHSDSTIINRIVDLAPGYDPDSMADLPSTMPGDDWGYTFINYAWDHLEQDFPGITGQQFRRCYIRAFEISERWTLVGKRKN